MVLPDLQEMVMRVPALVIGFSFHEFAHAWVAYKLGDDTAKLQGRVTLDPRSHLDPIGTLMLLLVGFGWAKPVPVDVSRLRPRVWGDIAVSLAGVTMNFLLAVLFYLLYGLVHYGVLGFTHPVLADTLLTIGWINIILVAFNLLPVPPLDGFRVASYLIPSAEVTNMLYRYSTPILLLLLVTDAVDYILGPVLKLVGNGVGLIVGPILEMLLL